MPVVISPIVYKEVTLTLDTVQYASGDVLAAPQELEGVATAGRPTMLMSLALLDKDDQGAALDIYILRTSTAFGDENAAAAFTDAGADELLTRIPIAASDYTDLGSSQFVIKNGSDTGMGIVMQPGAGNSLYVAAESGGTPTYTASGITLKLGFVP